MSCQVCFINILSHYSEWGISGWSVLGSVPLMGSGVFGSISAGSLDRLKAYALFPYIKYQNTDKTGISREGHGSAGNGRVVR